MRMAFGLVSLLIAVGLIAYLYSMKAGTDLKAGNRAREQVERITNTGADGLKAGDSIKVSPVLADGKLTGMRVGDLVQGGPMQKNFGLRNGDTITQLNGSHVGAFELDDFGMAQAQLLSPHGPDWQMTVLRDGHEITLPAGK